MCESGCGVPRISGNGSLAELLRGYLLECRESAAGDGPGKKKPAVRFPNIAGFCRYCGFGEDGLLAAAKKFPAEYGFVRSVLEDEALNADIPAALLTVYLKNKLGYGEKAAGGDQSQIKLLFEHDAYEDGV